MPNYVYNVVYRQGVERNMQPQAFLGSAAQFARATLRAWLASHTEHANRLIIVNVWDADADGAGVPASILCQLSNQELDEGPFDPDQINVISGHYHVVCVDYDVFEDDPVLGHDGADYIHGTTYGLIVPGHGPGLRIRAGHEGWIRLTVAHHAAEPVADLATWEAIEQITIAPTAAVRVANQSGRIEPRYPDLTGGRYHGYLALRVNARGRDQRQPTGGAANARRAPVEHHLIEAWPVPAPAPRAVLKRDAYSRDWERRFPG